MFGAAYSLTLGPLGPDFFVAVHDTASSKGSVNITIQPVPSFHFRSKSQAFILQYTNQVLAAGPTAMLQSLPAGFTYSSLVVGGTAPGAAQRSVRDSLELYGAQLLASAGT